MKYGRIVLHIPHSSIDGVEDSGWNVNEEFLSEVNKWTDWDTDKLFDCQGVDVHLGVIRSVCFPLSRFVLDVERLPNDELESVGQGRVYKRFGNCSRNVTKEEEERLISLYEQHQDKIISQLIPNALLIDCHSFPFVLSDIDVCIGYNDDWSKPPQEVIDTIEKGFSEAGYKVGINEPYSNSISPKCAFSYHSVMIELNKKIYWDEKNLKQTENASSLHALINKIISRLLNNN